MREYADLPGNNTDREWHKQRTLITEEDGKALVENGVVRKITDKSKANGYAIPFTVKEVNEEGDDVRRFILWTIMFVL